jgi:hypothetical protein
MCKGLNSRNEHRESGLIMERGSAAAVVLFNRHRARHVFCDLRNYIDKPGEMFARLVSLDWGKEPTEDNSDNEAMIVAMNRCEVMFEVVKRMVEWHNSKDFGKLELTSASCAMSAFKRLDKINGIELPDEQHVRDLERAAYHAGRTEPLWIGSKRTGVYTPHPRCMTRPGLFNGSPVGPFYMLDASSFYGMIYRECQLPKSLILQGDGMTKQEAQQLIVDDSWLATCQIVTKNNPFPYRDDRGSHFAVGRYTTTLCGPELRRAVQSGCVARVGKFHRYHIDYTLKAFAEYMWNERVAARDRGEPIVESWCKTLIAMLHGKFAQRSNQWEVCPDLQADVPWSHWQHWSHTAGKWIQYRAIGYEVQKELPAGDGKDCFPAIAAWVAANGREIINAWCTVAGKRNVLYIATDALIVTQQGYANLVTAGQIDTADIGSLRILESSDSVEIRGHGTYTIGDKIATQGIAYDLSDRVFGTISQTKQSGIEYAISHKGIPRILIQHSEVEPGWNYDPARVDDDGWLSPYNVVDNTVDFEHRKMDKSQSSVEKYF